MKKIITLSLALSACVAQPVHAETYDNAMQTILCPNVASFAKSVMQARQDGVEMQRIMGAVDLENDKLGMMRPLIMKAYAMPRFYSYVVKSRAAIDFSNDAFLQCMSISQDEFNARMNGVPTK